MSVKTVNAVVPFPQAPAACDMYVELEQPLLECDGPPGNAWRSPNGATTEVMPLEGTDYEGILIGSVFFYWRVFGEDGTVEDVVEQRAQRYGPPSLNHGVTADLWNAYWHGRSFGFTKPATGFVAEDVCMMNILQKISRISCGGHHDDSITDIQGYAVNVEQLDAEQLIRNHGE